MPAAHQPQGLLHEVRSLQLDSADNLYVAGHFSSPLQFGPRPLRSYGCYDRLVLAFDSVGRVRWYHVVELGPTVGADFLTALTVLRRDVVVVGVRYDTTTNRQMALHVRAVGNGEAVLLTLPNGHLGLRLMR